MGNDVERLNRLLDDLAAERDVAERAALSAADVALAETAARLCFEHLRSRRPADVSPPPCSR